MLQGWRLVWIASALLVASQFALFAAGGTEEAGVRMVVRASARISFAIFLLVYLAGPLRRLWPDDTTRWLRRNRRYLGVSFGVANYLHLLDIGMLWLLLGDAFERSALTLIVGGASYALLAGMMLTSFDRTARWLGPVWWNRLHRTGLHLLWFVFMQNYTGCALQMPGYIPLAVAVWGAAALRFAAWRAKRRSALAAPAAARAA